MEKSISEALALMRKALAILDQSDAPLEAGADLDLAIARLEGRFSGLDPQLNCQLEGARGASKDERELRH